MNEVYWSKIVVGDWPMYSAATARGLCYIGSPYAPYEELQQWVSKKIKSAKLVEDVKSMECYDKELNDYYYGKRKAFTVPLDLYGTTFQQKVWDVLQTIPYGKTWTYLEVAEKIQNPRAVRAVGGAIGANPILMIVPCHRVLAKSGKLGGFRAGLSMKKHLLTIENHNGK